MTVAECWLLKNQRNIKAVLGFQPWLFPPFLHSPSPTIIEYKIVYKSTVIFYYNIIVIYFMK